MVDPFSESELLEFIEDKLAPRRVVSLRRRLADHPAVERLVERLREDREALRATHEPALPIDFVAELEPQLARAAVTSPLAGTTPGAYRRRHRQASRRPHRVRYVAVAAVLLVVLGATWAAMEIGLRPGGASVELAGEPSASPGLLAPGAETSRDLEPSGSDVESMLVLDAAAPTDDASDASWPPPGSEVHHAAPLPGRPLPGRPLPGRPLLVANDGRAPAAGLADPAGSTDPIVGRFALVLKSPDHDAAERRLEAALTAVAPDGDASGALVRNYTAAEAALIVAQWHRKGMLADEPPDAISGLNRAGADPQRRARRLAGILRRHRAQLDEEVRTSRQLLGPKTLAPSYECQLDLSGRGATHTITVRVADLATVIAQLHEPGGTDLRPLSDADATAEVAATDDSALQQWIRHHTETRAFLDEMRATHGPDAWLMLPVVVEPAD